MIDPSYIKRIGVYGSGAIGGGLAAYFALKGLKVEVCDVDPAFAEKNILHALNAYLEFGIISDIKTIFDRISITEDAEEAFSDVYFVFENGPEKTEVKHDMIRKLEKCIPEDAIISSSSSSMPCSLISEGAKHPERILVSHPFNPSYLIPLMEISKSDKTEQKYVDWTEEFYKLYGKVPVTVLKDRPGFIANRLAHALWREEIALVTEGVCTLEDADNAVSYGPGIRWGIMGPALGYDLGAGDEGLTAMLEKYEASSNLIFEDLSNFRSAPKEFRDIAAEQIETLKQNLPEHIGHSISEIDSYRSKMLIELLRMRKLI